MSKDALLSAIQGLTPAQADTPTVAIFARDDAGCYADSARGQYIGCIVIDMAHCQGWQPWEGFGNDYEAWQDSEACSESYLTAWESFLTNREDYMELWEEAENYLNTLCDSDVYFGSSEGGDWGLWEIETDEEDIEL